MNAGGDMVAQGATVVIVGSIFLAYRVSELVFAIGAWSLKPWAWTLGIIVLVVRIVNAIILGALWGTWVVVVVPIVIYPIIIYYFNTRGCERGV